MLTIIIIHYHSYHYFIPGHKLLPWFYFSCFLSLAAYLHYILFLILLVVSIIFGKIMFNLFYFNYKFKNEMVFLSLSYFR